MLYNSERNDLIVSNNRQKLRSKSRPNSKSNLRQNTKPSSNSKLNPCDFTLCITVALLLALGIVMVLSASSPSSLAETGSSYTYVIRQLQSAIVGIVLMIFISRVDYKIYRNRKIYMTAYVVSVVILLFVLIPNIGVTVNGARRWVNLGLQFQPSEITKIGLIVFFAAILTENKDRLKKLSTGFLAPLGLVLIPVLILVVVQNHLSVTIVIIGVVSIMMLMAGSRPLHFATFGSAGVAVGAIGLFAMAKFTEQGAFRIARMTSFLNPWADAQGARMASNTGLIRYRVWRTIWSRTSETVNKNTYIYQNHTMTLYLQY